MTLEFDVDIGYITDDGSKDMPQWVKLNDEDGQHPSTVYVNNDSYQRSISENAKLRELVGDIWEFGFSNSAGASSVKEWYRVRDELEQRVYEALGVDDG